jgi:hypothetical protein
LGAQLGAQLGVQRKFSSFRRVGSRHKKTAFFGRFLASFYYWYQCSVLLVLCSFWGKLSPFVRVIKNKLNFCAFLEPGV